MYPNSFMSFVIHMASLVPCVLIMYSASVIDRTIMGCRLLLQEMAPCRNPTFGKVWGWHSHSRNGDLGVLPGSQNFKAQLQGSKHLALKHSSYHWKAIEV
jgi:hypothetical protein